MLVPVKALAHADLSSQLVYFPVPEIVRTRGLMSHQDIRAHIEQLPESSGKIALLCFRGSPPRHCVDGSDFSRKAAADSCEGGDGGRQIWLLKMPPSTAIRTPATSIILP